MVNSEVVAVETERLEVLLANHRIFGGVGGLLKDSEHGCECLPAPNPIVPLA